MTKNQKKLLMQVGKGVLYTAATGGAYILAKGVLNFILKKLTPQEATADQKAKAASSSSTKI